VPIYEFVCLDCGQKSSFLTPSFKTSLEPKCRKCGSKTLRKLVSRVAVLRSGHSGDVSGEEASGWEENGPKAWDDEGPPEPDEDDGGMGSDLD
jgi:putative FmdB family regulatory protein